MHIKRKITTGLIAMAVIMVSLSFRQPDPHAYASFYFTQIHSFDTQQQRLLYIVEQSDINSKQGIEEIKKQLQLSRNRLKALDFWFRYLEPTVYKKINGPLPVEWETEVFEKFEKPYRREGAGLTLAQLYLEEESCNKDSLRSLINQSITAVETYRADSITKNLAGYHHFFLCNRLFLLNLAAIYTTGFECPDTGQIIPELRIMLRETAKIYTAFNECFPETPLKNDYLQLYEKMQVFTAQQPDGYSSFDHFHFIRDYVNPLFVYNQQMIHQYKVVTRSLVDYSLNKNAPSIFSKNLYNGQNAKGIYHRVEDTAVLAEIAYIGKLLFYDPILSGNNKRSCASCHKPTQYFTDTVFRTSFQYNHKDFLARNSPSLLNAQYNHLIMLDGKHISLQNQVKAVVSNPAEMGGTEKDLLRKVLSCATYKKAFTRFLKYTPQEPEITFEHIASALTTYYARFSNTSAPFDEAMNRQRNIDLATEKGFNLFMSKAQCGTCHFIPQFNGVKPPYVGSEFEVLGVPEKKDFKTQSPDKGRYEINPATETMNAFRTGTIRNAAHTMPYMHNGVFNTLEEVVDFYNAGGGAGKGLKITNQTLSADSLGLSATEKKQLIQFIRSLDEHIISEKPPARLPQSGIKALNNRKTGGLY
ncbi:cytochrome-c peroxidase [Chitinophagaceae bacterium MMS25-I14]